MITITVDGVSYEVPSSAADTNWAAKQVAFEQALATFLNSVGAAPTWVAPTLLNSWANFNAGTDQVAQYTKDARGFVEIRGSIKSGAPSSIAFQLPAGYRPPNKLTFNCASSGGIVQCTIDTSGNFTVGLELGTGDPTTKTAITIRFSTTP